MKLFLHTNPYYRTRLLLSSLVFLYCACNNKSTYNKLIITKEDSITTEQKIVRSIIAIDSAKAIVKTGDLIVRTGNDFTSESLRSLNQRDKTYSHCGIASLENDNIFVYHAIGGEWNPDQKIRRDLLQTFAGPHNNRGIGIYRFQLSSDEIQNLITTVKKLYKAGIMFDMKFDLQTDDRMYCAEFVYKSYQLGSKEKLQFTPSHIGNFTFIGVDDIFLHPLCKEQKKILYK